jgi:hypothetical protein
MTLQLLYSEFPYMKFNFLFISVGIRGQILWEAAPSRSTGDLRTVSHGQDGHGWVMGHGPSPMYNLFRERNIPWVRIG